MCTHTTLGGYRGVLNKLYTSINNTLTTEYDKYKIIQCTYLNIYPKAPECLEYVLRDSNILRYKNP